MDDDELIAKIKQLPREGQEPDWDQFGRDLRVSIDADQRGFGAWLRRWWKPAFGLTLAGAAAAVVMFVHRPADEEVPAPVAAAITPDAAAAPTPPPVPVPVDDVAPLALGAEGDVPSDELDDDAVDDVQAALGPDVDLDDDDEDGLVPDLSLDWVDDLDDTQLDQVDRWLDESGHRHAG